MIRELKTKAEGEFTDYSSAVLVQDDVQCYRIVLDCNQQLDGASFQVTAKRADGEVIQDMGTVSGSRAEYVVANNMYAVMGEVVFRLTLVGADSSVLTAKELICNVVEANGEADLTGDDRVPALSALIAQASQAAAATDAANQAAQTANAAAEEANEAAQAASSVSSQIGDLDDLATNTKTNLVGAINELADFDEFTVTDDTYEFTTSKRNVIMHSTATEPANSSFFLNGTEQGQIITIYNPYWDGGTSDLWVDCYTPGSGGQESVNIRIGDNHTFQYANGNLWDLEACGARLIDYGVGSDYVKMEKPAKRYFVQVPVGNASIRDLRISNLDLAKDKKYYVNACIYAENTGHVDLFLPANFIDIVGCSITDGVYNGTMSGDLNFNSGGSDIYMHITGVFEPEMALQYVAGKLDVLYATADAVNIHHRTIHGIFGMFDAFSIQLNTGYGFLEGSYIEITTV